LRFIPGILLAAILMAAFALSYHVTDAVLVPPGQGYWHTSGVRIYDANNREVHINGVTWYGMETNYWVPAGLDYQPWKRIMLEVKDDGFNAIRLPFSNELVEKNPTISRMVAANPDLVGVHALDFLDMIVRFAQRIGLKIILDDHRSEASTPKTVNDLNEGLWYTEAYPDSSWIRDWQFLARRYKGNDAVIGFDLRNEPHTAGPGPWDAYTYQYQGATWGPYHGVDNPATDWRLAAERAGNAVLAINPHLLRFVEGLQLYPDPSKPSGVESYWWGSILRPVRQYPVVFKVPHQLVYSPHDWGPWKWNMSWFPHMTYESLQKVWTRNWAFIVQNPHASYAAPIWIGEFGTCTHVPGCITEVKQGNQAQWFQYFVRYLREHPEISWSFFALNGRNSNDHMANNGLLGWSWDDLRSVPLEQTLSGIQQGP
jgi:endoglucanase